MNRPVKVLLALLALIIGLLVLFFTAVWLKLVNFPYNVDLGLAILVEFVAILAAAIYLKYAKL